MKRLATLSHKNVYFTAFKINNSTDKMFDIMQRSFGSKFSKTNSTVPTEFFDTMFNTMT